MEFPTRQELLADAGVQSSSSSQDPSSSITVQVTSWHACDEHNADFDDEDDEEDVEEGDGNDMLYTIYGFGVDSCGRSVCMRVDGYTPFFFIKVCAHNNNARHACDAVASRIKETWPLSNHVKTATVMMKKDYWGFSNDALCPFVRVTFQTLRAMRMAAAMLKKPDVQKKLLSGSGSGSGGSSIELYESNIDPLLRFLHIRKLSPAGWMTLPGSAWRALSPRVSTCDVAVQVRWTEVGPADDRIMGMAPIIVAAFDIECTSAHGDFPVAVKDYSKLAYDLRHKVWASISPQQRTRRYQTSQALVRAMMRAFSIEDSDDVARLQLKSPPQTPAQRNELLRAVMSVSDDVYGALLEEDDEMLLRCLNKAFGGRWPLEGDPVIQIGMTYGVYGGGRPPCSRRIVLTLGSCADLPGTDVHVFEDELSMLLAWQRLVRYSDPDVIMGYNVFGFDFAYLYERATQLIPGESIRKFKYFGRLNALPSEYVVKNLSSSALGDNELKYIEMHGRVLIDLMKVVQRDHRLDSYKLDLVAEHFLKERKDDVSPNDIFRLQKGSSEDRAVIAKYCVQDCELCNRLASKLEILANNVGMANVCIVPLTYIFMRGQGIKIFSLVAKVCRDEGFVVPARSQEAALAPDDEDAGYEGAIVLEPQTGMYLDDPVCVLDYNSLYPSSMISHNLSHNTLVLDAKRYGNVPGVQYVSVSYDVNGTTRICRYATTRANGEPYVGVLPMILQRLLAQRKETRKRLAASSDAFERAVLDGLQNAYKVTANSLYGQMGARTSQLYLKDLAACTTAVGRSMILTAKAFVESNFDARVVYGDTDSIFVVFPHRDTNLHRLADTIKQGQETSAQIKPTLPVPHNLEYEKTFFPFILLSKKRYVGLLYGSDATAKPVQKSMGIALKRRDYAPIVKKIYGGVIDILLTKRDVPAAVEFLEGALEELAAGRYDLADLVISKTLRSTYKQPQQIAHWVLAERMRRRDPGSAPQVNDRIPYVFVEPPKPDALMGDRIEHLEYVKAHPGDVVVDTLLYIQRQIQQPCLQLLAIALEQLPGYVPRAELKTLPKGYDTEKKAADRLETLRERAVDKLIFEPVTSAMGLRQRARQEMQSRKEFMKNMFAKK
jgi:DNA polymerase elongation subunit (family B)